MSMEVQIYSFSVQNYQVSGFYTVEPYCNGFTVTNIGNTIVQVNDQIFYPGVIGVSLGDSRSFGGNQGEIYKGQIKVSFQFPLGTLPNIEVVQKIYILKAGLIKY